MSARALMFMGTGSDVGKSLIVAGLCRAWARRGIRVAPFKSQNMSNNAAVTSDGGEIGRAQALQARAAGRAPITAMNPVLLKPEHESGAQVILRGARVATLSARAYFAARERYLPAVLSAFDELSAQADLILVEGAGSASEINLRANDIANFGFAAAKNIPVIVIGDISRGGVIAALAGTFQVIAPSDARLCVGTLINRFQGDPDLFAQGLEQIEKLTGRPCFGPVPHFDAAHLLPAEDILGLTGSATDMTDPKVHVVVPRLPRMANFDDLDPLRTHPGVRVSIIGAGQALPPADLVILPGSKSTCADLEFFRQQGWDLDLNYHVRRGGHVLGICGGFQMLGQRISDPDGIEAKAQSIEGLGLLQVETRLTPRKQLRAEQAVDSRHGQPLTGYHMHLGQTRGTDCAVPFARVNGQPEGAVSANGQVMGTYLHGLFASDPFRHAFLRSMASDIGQGPAYEARIETVLDQLADHLEQHLDLERLLDLAASPLPETPAP